MWRHRCGALINTQPFLKRLEKGMEPNKAWEQAQVGRWNASMTAVQCLCLLTGTAFWSPCRLQLMDAAAWPCSNSSATPMQCTSCHLQADIEKGTIYGTWQADAFIVGPDSSGEFCHMNEIK